MSTGTTNPTQSWREMIPAPLRQWLPSAGAAAGGEAAGGEAAGGEAAGGEAAGARQTGLAVALTGCALFPATGAGLAFALALSLPSGLALGALLAVLVWTGHRWGGAGGARRLAQAGALLGLAAVTAAAIYKMAPAWSQEGAVDLVGAAPLPALALALYAFYLYANRIGDPGEAHILSRRLERVFSGPPLALTLLMAAVLATFLLLGLHYLRGHDTGDFLAVKFLERGTIPPLTLFLFCWGLLMILNKFLVLWREQRAFAGGHDRSVLLASFRYLRREHTARGLEYFLELLWKKSTDFYTLPRYINWAIPILGFIGTVLGISLAAEGIQSIIGAQGGLSQMSADLGKAISPLGIAFDTTLIALSLSVTLVLIQTALQRWEDNVLIDVEHRLRIMEEQAQGEAPA
ncbi:MAG: MotA/TolQ/ExbB proton channel family protein [Gammaproteobacteria bacterium]|nr:MotA/TolQ/ExbB proton channel family protein [Gammaproteobacteria bacterium]